MLLLVGSFLTLQVWAEANPASGSRSGPGAVVTSNAAEQGDDFLHWELFVELGNRPTPIFLRNPFEFADGPAGRRPDLPSPKPLPLTPAPRSAPLTFKAIGYQQDPNGKKQAYLDDGQADSSVYAAKEGEEFGQRFKVLKITDSFVEVQDETYHQVVQLPYPEPQ